VHTTEEVQVLSSLVQSTIAGILLTLWPVAASGPFNTLLQRPERRLSFAPGQSHLETLSIFILKKIEVMSIVHDIFICKPGNASKLAKIFKEVMSGNSELVNIMTDMTGQFNRVIIVTKYDSLTAHEQSWDKYKENSEEMKKMQEKMAGYTEMYLTGSREIYQVW
jgi:heme-degrading monooxygenase HmoA